MAEIVLATLNAKFIHASFGLRYLMANLGSLRARARLLEFDINQRPLEIVESLLDEHPIVVGLGVYIWNASQTLEVALLLKRLRPSLTLILGGPEVSYEVDEQPIVQLADFVVTGEGDLKFAEICGQILSGRPPAAKIAPGGTPDLGRLQSPYDEYDDRDIAHRVIYVEASRGCPFTCEFCLSSLDSAVRPFPLAPFLDRMDGLMRRGATRFKFVDRTFNLNLAVSRSILEFFHARHRPGIFIHFEMIPDRLPEALREVIARFPPGALQFEVGVQTFNAEVAARIRRRQNCERIADNLRFLRNETGVHIHADLIAGLPGETVESFAAGFDRLVAMGPQEIQVGILKRLRGTPIVRHDVDHSMVYSASPPYEILKNSAIDFSSMQRLSRFSRYWDLVANSGNFPRATPLLWRLDGSPFAGFSKFADWLHARTGQTHSISLTRLAEFVFEFLTSVASLEPQMVADAIWEDYRRGGRSDRPEFLRSLIADIPKNAHSAQSGLTPKRQARHLSGVESA